MSAVVAGSTGAIGRELVSQLVAADDFTRVVALSRRPLPEAEWPALWPGIDVAKAQGKLSVVVVPWDDMRRADEAAAKGSEGPAAAFAQDAAPVSEAFTGHDFAAMCLGTTKADAGSAERFREVDLGFPAAFAGRVKHYSGASLKHYSQVSSQGADASSFFLYMQTKGEADAMAVKYGFPFTSVMRPGLLGRGELMRGKERFFSFFVSPMPVADVAKAMLAQHREATAATPPASGVVYHGNGTIAALAKKILS